MAEKDYSKLSKTSIITDMYETDAEPLVLGGVAIPAKRCEEFIEAARSSRWSSLEAPPSESCSTMILTTRLLEHRASNTRKSKSTR